MNQHDVILLARGITKTYPAEKGPPWRVLNELDIEIRRGSFVVIRGANGSGKSTLLRILGLVDREFQGQLEICGNQVGAGRQLSETKVEALRASRIGFVFQEDLLLPLLTLRANSELPAQIHRASKREITKHLDRLTNLIFHKDERDGKVLERRRTRVSGGQCQRAAILRALSHRPSLILADEPTASLDPTVKEDVVQVFKRLQDEGVTILVVSHDPIFDKAGKTYELAEGKLQPAVSVGTERSRPEKVQRLKGCPFWLQAKIALLEAYGNPLFAIMIGLAMAAGLFQLTVLWSIHAGTEKVLDDVINKGSRLNRVTVSARAQTNDKSTSSDLPSATVLAGLEDYRSAVPRREILLRVDDASGRERRETAFGLIPDDPELEKLDLREGTVFEDQKARAVLISERSVERLFGATAVDESTVGKQIKISFRRYRAPEDWDEKELTFFVQGVVDRAESGRNFYLPRDTLMAVATWQVDLESDLLNPGRRLLVTQKTGAEKPIWERLDIYFDQLDQVLPAAGYLERRGFPITADLFRYKWILDTKLFVRWTLIGVFAMVVLITGLLIVSNVISGIRLKRKEIGILKLMGMKNRDVVSIFVLSVLLCALVGGATGFALGSGMVEVLSDFLSEEYSETPLGQILTSTWAHWGAALLICVVVAIGFTIPPAWRTARKEAVWKLN